MIGDRGHFILNKMVMDLVFINRIQEEKTVVFVTKALVERCVQVNKVVIYKRSSS